jgi:hypothetical protein
MAEIEIKFSMTSDEFVMTFGMTNDESLMTKE